MATNFIINLLVLKTFSHCTWKEWRFLRRSNNEPVYEHRIRECQKQLIKGYSSCHLRATHGAYFPLQSFFQRILDWKLFKHQLALVPSNHNELHIKISWDGYSHFHQKLESWYMIFYDVLHSQSSMHAHCFAISRMSESSVNFQTVCTEIDLNGFVQWLQSFNISINSQLYQINLMTSADWIGFIVELGAPRPGTRSLTDIVCPSCGCDKHYLRHLWLEHPWGVKHPQLSIANFPSATIQSLPLHMRRYDWMHGSALLLHHCLMNIYLDFTPRTVQKSTFFKFVEKFRKNWSIKNLLEPIGMKKWWTSDWIRYFEKIFNNNPNHHSITWSDGNTWICSICQMWTLLIDSCRVYYEFAYTQHPNQEDFIPLYYARHAICSIFAFKRWRLDPTTHFMLNEAIIYAIQDNGAYHTLQESVEHANHDVKEDCRCTSARDLTEALNHQELERRLMELNYYSAPIEQELELTYNKHSTIAFAKYTPLAFTVASFSD